MELFPLLFGATFGIGVIAGILHLVIGLARPRSPVHLLFGLVAILVGIQAIFVYANSQATTLAQFVALWKYGYGLTNTFALPAFLWFVALYTGFRPRRFLLGMTLFWFAFIVTPHFLLPTGIRINMVAIKQVTTSWGEQFTVHEGQPTAWLPVLTVWLLLYYGFCLYAPYRQWRRGDRAGALALGLPLIPLAIISLLYGRLIDAGIVQSPNLGNVIFVLVIIPMGLQLAYDAVTTKRALRASEQRLRAFVTRTHEGIWTVDFAKPLPLNLPASDQVAHVRRFASQIADSNRAMARILGYESRDELIGRDIFDVFSPALPENEKLLERVVAAGFRVSDLVSPAVSREGKVRYLEGNLTPIVEDGHVVRVWGASRDVTERLRMAEELRQHREELAELVSARTAQLEQANKQLTQEVAERQQAEKALAEREALLSQVLDLLPVGVWITDTTGQIVSGNPAGQQIWGGIRYVGPEEFDVYKAWWVDSGERIAADEWAGVRAIRRGETSIGEFIEIETFDGARKFLLNSAVPLRGDANEIIGAIIVNEDVTGRRQVELELQQRVQQLSALHEIAGTLSTLSDLPQGLPRVAETVTGLFQVDSVHLILSTSADDQLMLSGYGRKQGPLGPAPLGLDLAALPLTRQVLREKRAFTTTANVPLATTAPAASFLQTHDIASFMLVPLVATGEPLGVMAVNSAAPDRAFTADEVRLAETIAADVAAAVANLHLLAQTKETAALQERQRIASELHDSVTQTIYSVGIMAQTLPHLVREEKYTEAEQNATRVRLATLGALAQMRTLLFELRPAALAEARLGVLLQQLGDALTGQSRVPVDLVVRGDGQPPVDVKITFYRIAQEVFNNIAKHAQATHVAATLRSAPDALEMRIVDDGRGFDVTSDVSGQMGLRIMGERAAGIGAELQFESEPGRGTTVTLSWKVGS
jgi:PAS domain S-box-containing protein